MTDAPLTETERLAPFICPRCQHYADAHGSRDAACNVGDFLNPCGCPVRREDIPGLVLRNAIAERLSPPVKSDPA